jgi:uncharacterized protein YbbK (DUF523 family)
MPTPLRPILTSACLLGLNTRYNGCCKKNQAVVDWLSNGGWLPIPVCPEQLGGLPTPRPEAQYTQGDGRAVLDGTGRVVSCDGTDLNAALRHGAEQTLAIARLSNCRIALLKERSPSCGVHAIYRQGAIVSGSGVTTALLEKNGVQVFCEEDLAAGSTPEPDHHV